MTPLTHLISKEISGVTPLTHLLSKKLSGVFLLITITNAKECAG